MQSLSPLATAFIAMLQTLLPALVNSQIVDATLIAKIVAALAEILPVAVKEAEDVVPIIKDAIVALAGNKATTADELAQLAALEVQYDADFDKAAAAALAADAANGALPPAAQAAAPAAASKTAN